MIQLEVLTGKKAGAHWCASSLPVRIGRAAGSDLCFVEEGIWERHLEINLRPEEGFVLSTQGEAFAAINGEATHEKLLRNGDLIEIGALRIRFGLSPTRQRGLRWREVTTWLALATLCLGQIALVYWLLG